MRDPFGRPTSSASLLCPGSGVGLFDVGVFQLIPVESFAATLMTRQTSVCTVGIFRGALVLILPGFVLLFWVAVKEPKLSYHNGYIL